MEVIFDTKKSDVIYFEDVTPHHIVTFICTKPTSPYMRKGGVYKLSNTNSSYGEVEFSSVKGKIENARYVWTGLTDSISILGGEYESIREAIESVKDEGEIHVFDTITDFVSWIPGNLKRIKRLLGVDSGSKI